MSDKKIPVGEFIDRYGNRIVRGDVIVYGNNLGRCAKTAVGKVLSIFETDPKYYWQNKEKAYKLAILSIQSDFGNGTGDAKKVTLQETERVLKYPVDLLPKHIREKLELA